MDQHEQRRLLTGLNSEHRIDWLPELKAGKDAFAFILKALRGDKLSVYQRRNALAALMKLRAIGNGDDQDALNAFVDFATDSDCSVRSEALTLAVGLLELAAKRSLRVCLTEDQTANLCLGIKMGVEENIRLRANEVLRSRRQ